LKHNKINKEKPNINIMIQSKNQSI